ncbi:MAG TPA: peptidase S10 [Alphaproteobacteria bacterium]|nr:peptidase S10 [Alphaproteobacteria bacterium]
MMRSKRPLLAALLLVAASGWPPGAAAEEAAAQGSGDAHRPASAAVLPADKSAVTHHVIRIDGRDLSYQAVAGILPVAAMGDLPEARIFYVSYTLDGADKKDRPVTFAFNGGPGAASAYLHLGAIGPRRLVLDADGTVPSPPARFADNPLTWLTFTDLVFIDPVGTGFSRGVSTKAEKGEATKGEQVDDKPFFGTRADNLTLGRVIRLYLTRSDRWLSPKFLVGESYGGFRVASLAEHLQSDFGIALNGAVLISPVLDFALIRSNRYGVLPWALKLPTLAAVALYHGKSSLPHPAGGITRAALAEVESWSLEGYLTGLAQGDALPAAAEEALVDKLAAYTGLPKDLVARSRGRIRNGEFAKMLLHGTGRVVGFYDGSVTALDPDPESPVLRGEDRTLPQLNAALGPAFNAYLREELKFDTDLPYLVLNPAVGRQWHWHGESGDQGFAEAIGSLKAGVTFNPHLKVLIAHGLFDLVTPYFASAYAISQMNLDPAVRANVALKTYAAGHMIYTHRDSREALFHDAADFFRGAAAAAAPRTP